MDGLRDFDRGSPKVVLSNLWCSKSGHHLHEDLAKFGYKPDMEIFLKI
jgi:hypothetical protein